MTTPPFAAGTSEPEWLEGARAHAMKYLVLFVQNTGVEKIVAEFDTQYADIEDPVERLYHLAEVGAREWDFRKGRERYEVTETFAMDAPDSRLGAAIYEAAKEAEMASASKATLQHYSIVAVLGGAFRAPYNRLKYALEQRVSYDMIAYLGSEREVLPAEREKAYDYAPQAQTEFDLGVGAIQTLLADTIVSPLIYVSKTLQSRVAHIDQQNKIPILILSAPPNQGGARANTADAAVRLYEATKQPL